MTDTHAFFDCGAKLSDADNFLLQALLESTGAELALKILRATEFKSYLSAMKKFSPTTFTKPHSSRRRECHRNMDAIVKIIQNCIDAMRKYLSLHHPVRTELRGTFKRNEFFFKGNFN